MKHGALFQLLCAGIVIGSAATPAGAIASVMPFSAPDREMGIAPEPGVVTSEDLDSAKIEKVYYGHWRRVHRRVYRRHYYYHNRYYHPYRYYHHPYHYYHRRYYY